MLFDAKLTHLIEYWAMIQLVIIILLILVFLLTRLIMLLKSKHRQKVIDKICKILTEINTDANVLTNKVVQYLNKYIFEFIICLDNSKLDTSNINNWQAAKKILNKEVLWKQAKILSNSSRWFNRYLATRCYELAENTAEQEIIIKLVHDKTVLIMLNSALLIINNATAKSINALIDAFSNERRLLQTTLVNILKGQSVKDDKGIVVIINKRLQNELDPYVRMFCYRILSTLKASEQINYCVPENDLINTNVDLKIAALKYLAHSNYNKNKSILLSYLKDTNNDVRAAVIKALRRKKDLSLFSIFESMLKDPSWWVRINSAIALTELGEDGIIALKSQSIEKDKFAYETAQAALKIYKKNEG